MQHIVASSLFTCAVSPYAVASGAGNMAHDEALAGWAGKTGAVGVRFYGWTEPTLSLGYFQKVEERAKHEASIGLPFVRRPSGGGAIMHDRELTYAIGMPASHPLAPRAADLYYAVHASLRETLVGLGAPAELCEKGDERDRHNKPFLCFARRARHDVLLDGRKVGGSAQRRFREGVMMHGSVLLAQSEYAAELPGIRELAGLDLDPEGLAGAWKEALLRTLGAGSVQSGPGCVVKVEGNGDLLKKYESVRWDFRHEARIQKNVE